MKNSVMMFVLLGFTQFIHGQTDKEINSLDSIIIEITNNYCQILPNQIDKENANKCYSIYLNGRNKAVIPLCDYYSSILKDNNLKVIDSTFFSKLIQLKKSTYGEKFSFELFFDKLEYFSDSISKKNENNEFVILSKLKNEYLLAKNVDKEINKIEAVDNLDKGINIELIVIVLLSIIIIILVIRNRKKPEKRKNIKLKQNSENNLNGISEQLNKKDQEIQELRSIVYQKDCEIRNLKTLLDSTKSDPNPKTEDKQNMGEEIIEENNQLSDVVLFSRQPNFDGNFRDDLMTKVFENSLSMVKFSLSARNKATFEYCGDSSISKLISNNPDSSIGLVSDYENSRDFFKTSIETTQKGEVELIDSIWYVTKKAKIKFG